MQHAMKKIILTLVKEEKEEEYNEYVDEEDIREKIAVRLVKNPSIKLSTDKRNEVIDTIEEVMEI